MAPRGPGVGSWMRGQAPAPLKSHTAHLPSATTSVAQTWAQGVAGAGWGVVRPQNWCRPEAARCLLVCLQDSVLAFWSHGMQGRSLDTNEVSGTQDPGCSHNPTPCWPRPLGEDLLGWPQCLFSSQVTQEITDETRIFRVLGAHR